MTLSSEANSSSNANSNWVLGIRREDKNRWERRAPVAPSHVAQLVKKGVKVIIQPSTLRTYSDKHYKEAGAIVQEDLSEAGTIIAVKEVPTELLQPNKTYLYFSHTIKAQQQNMRMLDDILSKKIRLIDYEAITDNRGSRLVRFGKFAGYAGTIDTLHSLGDRLLALGHSTPFLHIGYSYCYSSVEAAKAAVSAVGEEIEHYGLPQPMVPFIFAITSESGNVSQGAQEIFKLLPHKMIDQKEMQHLVEHPEEASPYLVYGVITTTKEFSEPKDPSKEFSKEHYYNHPEEYRNTFYEKYAPYVTVILNCMYWDHRFPRLITIKQMEELTEAKRSRLVAVGDITCDRMGSIEFLMKTTSIDQPLFIYDPLTGDVHDPSTDNDWIYSRGVLFCAVDNFPTEFPKEATNWFGDNLIPFLEAIVKSDMSKPYDQQTDLPEEIHKAVIACHGQLTPKFTYIFDLRRENEKSLRNILILGAGMVARPAVEFLSRKTINCVTVADINLKAAQDLASGRSNCSAALLDINDGAALEQLISSNTVVLSLLPATLHFKVAQVCLKLGKNLVTTSYISPEMRELHAEVQAKGLTFLNEIGLDPGIDHLEAKRVIDSIKKKGGKVRSFVSWCGGLPMPEASINPLGYKFSWSPRGALAAATKDAKYLQEGQTISIPGSNLFKATQKVNIFPGFSLEGFPNRDSISYLEQYGLDPKEVKTMFRGTLRYTGFSSIMQALVQLGLLSDQPVDYLEPSKRPANFTWDAAFRILIRAKDGNSTRATLKHMLRADPGFPHKGYDADHTRQVLRAAQWLGFYSQEPLPNYNNWLDCVTELLQKKLAYEPLEHDMIILHHMFGIDWPEGRFETRSSTLVVHGSDKSSAMSRTVALPAAIAVDLILEGQARGLGVVAPMDSSLYKPILRALDNEGIRFIERSHGSHKAY